MYNIISCRHTTSLWSFEKECCSCFSPSPLQVESLFPTCGFLSQNIYNNQILVSIFDSCRTDSRHFAVRYGAAKKEKNPPIQCPWDPNSPSPVRMSWNISNWKKHWRREKPEGKEGEWTERPTERREGGEHIWRTIKYHLRFRRATTTGSSGSLSGGLAPGRAFIPTLDQSS